LVRLLQVFNQRQFFEELLDLNQIIQELEKYILPIIGNNIIFSVQKSPELWPIRADKSRIRQALLLWFSRVHLLLPQGGQATLGTENFVSTPNPAEAQPKYQQEVRIHTEIAGCLAFSLSLSNPSDETEVMNCSMQKLKQATTHEAEIIHSCRGHISYNMHNENSLYVSFNFPAETASAS
jgi:hypothetical protein